MVLTAGTAPRPLALRCKDCGEALTGLTSDRVFSCAKCRTTAEPREGKLLWRGFTSAKPHVGEGPWLYFPFWEFAIDYELRSEDELKLRLYRERWSIERVFVMGFSAMRVAVFGDPGLSFTTGQPEIEPDDRGFILGCTRTSRDARTYVELFLLSILDRTSDITGVEPSVRILSTRLVAVPFSDQGSVLVDGLLGTRISAAAFSDLSQIRRFRAGRS